MVAYLFFIRVLVIFVQRAVDAVGAAAVSRLRAFPTGLSREIKLPRHSNVAIWRGHAIKMWVPTSG
jgi:hypothetical protein